VLCGLKGLAESSEETAYTQRCHSTDPDAPKHSFAYFLRQQAHDTVPMPVSASNFSAAQEYLKQKGEKMKLTRNFVRQPASPTCCETLPKYELQFQGGLASPCLDSGGQNVETRMLDPCAWTLVLHPHGGLDGFKDYETTFQSILGIHQIRQKNVGMSSGNTKSTLHTTTCVLLLDYSQCMQQADTALLDEAYRMVQTTISTSCSKIEAITIRTVPNPFLSLLCTTRGLPSNNHLIR
jgi:hypothetical protein